MQNLPLYDGIALLLSQCGIISIRMFMPSFLYLLLLRFHDVLGAHCPQMVIDLAAATPAWLLSDASLIVWGVLALLEYIAQHDDSVREFLTGDFDRIAKAVFTFLAAYAFIDAGDAAAVRELAPAVAGVPAAAAGALVCGGVTWGLCGIRQKFLEMLRTIDSDNSLGLHRLASRAEDLWCLLAVFFLVILPLAALVITGLNFLSLALFRIWLARREKIRSHACPQCAAAGRETIVANAAEICPQCHSPQPRIYAAGWLGIATATPLAPGQTAAQRLTLLRARRCPLCALPTTGDTCPHCGAAIWEQGYSRGAYAAKPEQAAVIIAVAAVLLTAVPVWGLLLSLVLFNIYVLRPLRLYQTWAARVKGKFLLRFLRNCALLVGLVFSCIPFAGLLTFLPYWLAYRRARRDFLNQPGN